MGTDIHGVFQRYDSAATGMGSLAFRLAKR